MPPLRNIFEVKSSRVVRVLLVQPNRAWTLRGIAQESQASLGITYYVAASLIQMGTANRDESNKFILTDPHRLIRQWAASYNYLFLNKFSEYYSFDTQLEDFLVRIRRIPRHLHSEYALTLHAAAWMVTPYVRPTDFHIYIRPGVAGKELQRVVMTLKISPIEKGGNVKLVTPYDEGVFYASTMVKGVRIVSPVQLYVDLYNHPGRGEEAAGKLLEKITREWEVRQVVRHRTD